MKKTNKYQPKEWQRNPQNVETSRVQFWANGIMVTAQMTLETAREKVSEGTAFVISGQAIGAMKDGYANS